MKPVDKATTAARQAATGGRAHCNDAARMATGIMDTLGVVEEEALVKEVGLERVEGRVKLREELPGTLQVGFANPGLGGGVDVGTGKEFAKVGVNEVLIAKEVLLLFPECIELCDCECAVDIKLTKSTTFLCIQVREDDFDQSGKVRIVGPAQQIATLGGCEFVPAGKQAVEFVG